jgi:hypothetical protein
MGAVSNIIGIILIIIAFFFLIVLSGYSTQTSGGCQGSLDGGSINNIPSFWDDFTNFFENFWDELNPW